MGDLGFCVWFTGLPCSGKTTISKRLAQELEARRRTVTLLDGDDIRPILCPDLGYSAEDRLKNVMRLAFVAREVVRHRGIAIVAAVSPRENDRQLVRRQFGPSFIQVFVDTPLAECERRDVKGMYALARKGDIAQFTGVGSPYERPAESEVVCDTLSTDVQDSVEIILAELELRSNNLDSTIATAAGVGDSMQRGKADIRSAGLRNDER